ncbi:hypothetical protein RND71_015681 [Anisodus tanguticus]|uniref:Receptor-like serine/threonine-protein kinase n=1 Tax=Anisodus tanguticus TaxID=243964 RepID=A0AAE1S7W1_9SOLA|nr:hypothetical protein RND71_015681 [Anisodus tanguticus]
MAAMLSLLFTICHLLISITSYASCVTSTDTLFPNQVFWDGQTLVSPNQRFEMGFFGFGYRRYLGLWYKNIGPNVIWVGNRMSPLCSFARLILDEEGNICLYDLLGTSVCIYKPNQIVHRPVLQLLDSGNLVFGDSSNLTVGEYLWQSFDHPVDTLLPGMKLGWDQKSGINRTMISWRTIDDPALGDYSFKLESGDSGQSPQLVLEKKQQKVSRWGPWDGQRFSGSDALMAYKPNFNTDSFYFTSEAKNDWSLRLAVNPEGKIQFLRGSNGIVNILNKDICDQYNTCGPYGVCFVEDPSCRCPDGFSAASPDDWDKMDFIKGCKRITALNYTKKDAFVKNTGLKLPDNATYWGMLRPKECGEKCLNEKSCMAYTNININGNDSKCLVWLGDLFDMRNSPKAGNDIFIRIAHGKLEAPVAHGSRKRKWKLIAFAALILVLTLLILSTYYKFLYRAMRTEVLGKSEINQPEYSIGALLQDMDVIAYDSSALAAATNNFSLANKIGHGGFGNVYKGVLENGVEIAVKKQDVTSRQGVKEFENEVKLIAKLQHRNLTKLLGYCIHGTEKFLVYEFMANNSLDKVIFDVFSFGILALEIVSGQRNWGYRHPIYDIGLVGYAWTIWNERKGIELLDPMIEKPGDWNEVLVCVLVGLLCCQCRAQDRPSMVQVVSLLEENEMSRLNCVPLEPYFSKERTHSSRSRESVNGITITELTGRS